MHPDMAVGWTCPKAPAEYPTPTAIQLVQEFQVRWKLDFSKVEVSGPLDRFYASDSAPWKASAICHSITWPWAGDFWPTKSDWEAIGFDVVVMREVSQEIRPASDREVAVRDFVTSRLVDPETAKGILNE